MKLENVKIGDLGKVVTGTTPPTNRFELYGNYIPFIKPSDIEYDTKFTPSPKFFHSELGAELFQKFLVPKGSTCVVTIGSIGEKITQAKTDCFTNQQINAVIPNEFYNCDYVFYLLKHNLYRVKGANQGSSSGRENVAKSTFIDINIKVTKHLPTQRKIASILSAYDDLIENNLKRVKLLEEKLMIEYSLLEEESKNLKELDFSNFVTFIKGIEPGTSNYLSEKSEGTIPFIRVGDLGKRDSNIFIEKSKSKAIISNTDDVLVSMDGTIGIVKYGIYGCYSSGIRKSVSNGVLNNAFIFCYLSSKKIQGVIYSHSKGSTIQHAGSSINHFKIKLPKESSLNDFNRFSNPIYDMMNNLQKQNSKLREARDILLPKLMTGQIEV
jgi:type I restriction enzyme S subunit